MNTATLTQIENNNLQPRRTGNGGLVPVIGTPLQTPYGAARVVGYDDGNLKVEITDYNEDINNVDNKVAELAKARKPRTPWQWVKSSPAERQARKVLCPNK